MSGEVERIVPESSTDTRRVLDAAPSKNSELGVPSTEVQQLEIDDGEQNSDEEPQYLTGWKLYGLILGQVFPLYINSDSSITLHFLDYA